MLTQLPRCRLAVVPDWHLGRREAEFYNRAYGSRRAGKVILVQPLEFCYWLQGFFELAVPTDHGSGGLSQWQAHTIQDHLALVFKKTTPVRTQYVDPFKSVTIQPFVVNTPVCSSLTGNLQAPVSC